MQFVCSHTKRKQIFGKKYHEDRYIDIAAYSYFVKRNNLCFSDGPAASKIFVALEYIIK